jgi:hypothetical protein
VVLALFSFMDKALLLLILIYAAGYGLAQAMLRTEHASEGQVYTRGHRLFTYLLALFSWGMVLWLLTSAWFSKIQATGYWNQPVKKEGAK